MKPLVEDLHGRREKAKLGGGEEKIALQHERGKLTARERIDLLVDPGTFVELGIQAGPHFSQRAMEGKEAPADGVITGWGDVDGRPCCIAAYDFTVMAGSMGMTGELKVGRLREMALQKRMPMIWLLDSAGARIQEAAGLDVRRLRPPVPRGGDDVRRRPAGRGDARPLRGGHRLHPGPRPTSCRWSSARGRWRSPGPHLTKAVTGEDISMEDLGGARVHCRKSGVGDLEVEDDAECIEAVKRLPLLLPVQLRGEAAAPRDDGPRRPDVGDAARHRPRVVAPALRHVRA